MQSTQESSSADFHTLLDATRTRVVVARFAKAAAIFRQGDRSEDVLLIDAGLVQLLVTKPDGRVAVCGILEPGAFLGEEVLANHFVRRRTAIAMTPTEVIVIPKDRMIELLRTQPAISDRFLAHVLARHTRLENDLADQLLHSGEQRLASALLKLTGCDEQCPSGCEMPHVSQEVIAEMVGTTRSRVNGFIGKFEKLGFIERDGKQLLVRPSLRSIVDNEPDDQRNMCD